MIDIKMAKRMILAPLTTQTTEDEIAQFAQDLEGIDIHSVIVDEFYISFAQRIMPNRKIGTIASYPFGGFSTEMNMELIKKAVRLGCSEVDISPKFNYIKSGKYSAAKEDLIKMVEAAQGKLDIVAVPQVGQMTLDEIERVCKLFLDSGIHIIKTNTGFNQGKTEIEHITFIRRKFGSALEIEVSGGVRTREEALAYIDAGVDRIHSSTWKSVIGWTEEVAK